ncbi:McrC family protein [Photobacterium sagamiensis]|uniref:McrC family protein n=1 Tax=Photobacterium sagamiensis TaxID=2910241 RepID=UPI003D12B4B3
MSKVKKDVTVFEFGYLGKCEKAEKSERIHQISKVAFNYLKGICLCDESESRFLRLKSIDNAEVLQVQNYTGVLFTPDGTQIEVLPKIGKHLEGEKGEIKARNTLIIMLKALKQFRHIQTHNANLTKQKMPLLEVFITQFLDSVNTLVKRGVRSDYVRREDNLPFLKGKLKIDKQLQHNAINKHKFYVEYDDFLQDRPANRLVHAALKKVTLFTRSAHNQKLLRELMFVFHDIPTSTNHKLDFSRVKLDRGMSYYEIPLDWTRLILEGFSPLTMKGQSHAFSLLFPMEAVFESYVGSILRKQLVSNYSLVEQAQSKSLVVHNSVKYFRLKPDFVIKHDGQEIALLDTKWKLINQNKANGSYKYGLSQADMYQMFAYGHKYLGGKGNMFLIYPEHDEFTQAIDHCFDFDDNGELEDDKKLKLWVVPFVIEINGKSRLLLPRDEKLKAQIFEELPFSTST